MKKLPVVFGILVLLQVSSLGLEFDGETDAAVSSSQDVELTYTNVDLDGNVNVTYYNGTEELQQVNSSPYTYEFKTDISEGNYDTFEIEAEASNGNEFNERTATLTIDRQKPGISGVDPEKYGNGSILFNSFSAGDDATSVSETRLIRHFDGDEQVDSSESGNLYDENEDLLYGEFNYTIEAEDEVGNIGKYHLDEEIVPKDGMKPELVSVSPEDGKRINNQKTTSFEVTVKDNLSGLEEVNVTLGNKKSVSTGLSTSEETVSFTIEEFDGEETFTADIELEDSQGNQASYESSFTTDRSAPELDLEKVPDQEFLSEETEIGMEYQDGDTSQLTEIRCILGGDEIGTDFQRNNNDIYDCGEADPEDYDEGRVDLEAEIEDDVENVRTVDVGHYTVDNDPPEITELKILPEKGWKNPQINVTASDDASEVEKFEYQVGNIETETLDDLVNLRTVTESFRPDIEDLQESQYEIKLRAIDKAGRSSEYETIRYHYRPDARPEPRFEFGAFETESNRSRQLKVRIANSGTVGLINGNLSVSGPVTGSKADIYVPADTNSTVSVTLEPRNSAGLYNASITLISDSKNLERTLPVTLRATPEEENRTRKRLSELESTVKRIESNISKLSEEGVKRQKISNLMSDKRSLENTMYNLEEEIDQNRYYAVAERLPGVENRTSTLSSRVENVEASRQRFELILLGASGLLLMALILTGYHYSERTREIEEAVFGRIRSASARVTGALLNFPGRRKVDKAFKSLRYGETGTKLSIAYYKVKRKVRKLLGKEGVQWKGYH